VRHVALKMLQSALMQADRGDKVLCVKPCQARKRKSFVCCGALVNFWDEKANQSCFVYTMNDVCVELRPAALTV
jgi:hypothetical protein